MTALSEHLTKAADCATFVRNDLRQALAEADPVTVILLYAYIERAAILVRDVATLRDACEARAREASAS